MTAFVRTLNLPKESIESEVAKFNRQYKDSCKELTNHGIVGQTEISFVPHDLPHDHEQRRLDDDETPEALREKLTAAETVIATHEATIADLRRLLSDKEMSPKRITRADAERLLMDRCDAIRSAGGFDRWLKSLTTIKVLGLETNAVVAALDAISELALSGASSSIILANALLSSLQDTRVPVDYGRLLVEAVRRCQGNSKTRLCAIELGWVSISAKQLRNTSFTVFSVQKLGVPREKRAERGSTKFPYCWLEPQ